MTHRESNVGKFNNRMIYRLAKAHGADDELARAITVEVSRRMNGSKLGVELADSIDWWIEGWCRAGRVL